MIINDDKGFVILDIRTELFYCGLNKWDKQLRKAQIYHSKKHAEEYIYLKDLGSRCVILPVTIKLDYLI